MDFAGNAANYVNVRSWIVYMLLSEVAGNADGITNNINIASWDASASEGHWYAMLYDCDETWGVYFKEDVQEHQPESIGLITEGALPCMLIWKYMLADVKAEWSRLRSADIISAASFEKRVRRRAAMINYADLYKDAAQWDQTDPTGNFAFLLDWGIRRIAWLDTQLGYTAAS